MAASDPIRPLANSTVQQPVPVLSGDLVRLPTDGSSAIAYAKSIAVEAASEINTGGGKLRALLGNQYGGTKKRTSSCQLAVTSYLASSAGY